MSPLLKIIQKKLAAHASASFNNALKKFVPGITKSYGVPMPVINQLAKEYKEGGFELVEELGSSEYIEEKILAAKLLGKIARKNPEKALSLFSILAKYIDNWAVCDSLGMQSLKPLVKTHSAAIFALATKYNRSTNPWLRRLSLVMVEWYTREKKHHSAIRTLVSNLQNDNEYYVKKAVIWITKNFLKGK